MRKSSSIIKRRLTLISPIIIVALLSLIQSLLIFLKILPPVSSYSLWNLFFSCARLIVIVYVGIVLYEQTLKKSAFYGGVLGFVTAAVLSAVSIISKIYFGQPILGISIPSESLYLPIMMIIILQNVLLGIIIAVGTSLITRKIKHK